MFKRRTVAFFYILMAAMMAGGAERAQAAVSASMTWSSYVGGSDVDIVTAVTVDGIGNIYVTGVTKSTDWITGGYDTTFGGGTDNDVFVAKITPWGQLAWSTYLGGDKNEGSRAIIIDPMGNILIVGATSSSGWVSGGYNTVYRGTGPYHSMAFVVKLSSSGQALWSSYIGGTGVAYSDGIVVDAASNIFVTGGTFDCDQWVSGGFNNAYNGSGDSFIIKLTSAGAHVWSSFIGITMGGTEGIAIDSEGNACVVGEALTALNTPGFLNSITGGWDAFVLKISAAGKVLWGEYLGGSYDDFGIAVATGESGNLYVAGNTESPTWTRGGYDTTSEATTPIKDAFLAKLSPGGRMLWSTFVGGPYSGDFFSAFCLDNWGNIYVTGTTLTDTWMTGIIMQDGNIIKNNSYLVKCTPSGHLVWSAHFGGKGLAIDGSNNVVVAGNTGPVSWISGGFDTTYGGPGSADDGFVTQLGQGMDVVGHATPPEVITSGAQWRLAGETAWRNIGEVADLLAAGEVTVEFKPVSGWTTPEPKSIILIPGDTIEVTGAYGGRTGSLQATLSPNNAVAGGARWRRQGTTEWLANGEAEPDLMTGNYTVEFKPLTGWITPPPQTVTIQAGKTAQLAASYKRIPGGIDWSTYLGGSGNDYCCDIARDSAGNLYVAGYTASSDWLYLGYDTSFGAGGYDGFVYKFTAEGLPLWGTYLGGSGDDQARTVAVDPATGDCYVGGQTKSDGWISGGTFTSLNGGSLDAFVVKLSSAGKHLWSTYLGGNSSDYAQGIAVDPSGNVCLVGSTMSSGWTFGGYDTTQGGGYDAFAYKLSASGVPLWSTYLGGSGYDYGLDVVCDPGGNFYVIGNSDSPGWVSGGYNTSAGGNNGFVVKLSPAGQHVWSTLLGGSGSDYGFGIALDGKGNVLAVGQTNSAGWVSGNYQNDCHGSSTNGYLVKMAPDGKHLWSTYLGGRGNDIAFAVATDNADNIFVTGNTNSSDWAAGGLKLAFNGPDYYDAFVAKLSPGGQHLWSTLMGGSTGDTGYGILTNGTGTIYITGCTNHDYSSWVSGGLYPNQLGAGDGFLIKMSDAPVDPAGTVRVGIGPAEAIRAGAVWRITGVTSWRYPADAIPCLPVGNYQVEFKDLSTDWITPAPVTVAVKDGGTIDLAGQYKSRLDLTLHSPLLMTVKPGDSAVLAATASGLAPIKMQWKKNGAPIAGATGTTLYLSACQVTDEAFYTCEASNLGGTLSTPPIHLIVNSGGSVLAYLLGFTTDPAGLDLNKDGKVNVADVMVGLSQTPAGLPGNPNPTSGTLGVGLWPHLDWDDCLRAKRYDVFLWPAGAAEPTGPQATSVPVSQWDVPTTLSYGMQYQWRVVAHAGIDSLPAIGPVWGFTTAKAVRVVSPNGGEVWTRGATAQVTWKAVPLEAGTTVRIELWRGTGTKICVLKSASSDPGGLKTETITVPASAGDPPAFDYRIRVISTALEAKGAGSAAWDESDSTLRLK